MEIRRTANAGVLLKLDGVSILMDGVCREVKPYPATPPEERALLSSCYPDVMPLPIPIKTITTPLMLPDL